MLTPCFFLFGGNVTQDSPCSQQSDRERAFSYSDFQSRLELMSICYIDSKLYFIIMLQNNYIFIFLFVFFLILLTICCAPWWPPRGLQHPLQKLLNQNTEKKKTMKIYSFISTNQCVYLFTSIWRSPCAVDGTINTAMFAFMDFLLAPSIMFSLVVKGCSIHGLCVNSDILLSKKIFMFSMTVLFLSD